MNIFAEAARLEEENRPFALAQIIESRGSTPRHSGQMLVMADGGCIGTIGGGMIERLVIEQAIAAIAERKARVFHGRMARTGQDAVGSDCGGAMSVYIDVHGLRPRLILIGAGHVNRAIANAAKPLGFDIHVADIYPASLDPALFPVGTTLVHGDTFPAAIDKMNIDPANFVIIATNNQDCEALNVLIEQPLRYLGLLASRRKVQTFTQQLRQRGVEDEKLARLHAPVGYNIGAETPEEIAISVLAELLQVRNQSAGGLMKNDIRLTRDKLVVIRGAGDIATGVALRLFHAGFQVIMLDIAQPTAIRRTVAFAQAMFDGKTCVEGVTACLANGGRRTGQAKPGDPPQYGAVHRGPWSWLQRRAGLRCGDRNQSRPRTGEGDLSRLHPSQYRYSRQYRWPHHTPGDPCTSRWRYAMSRRFGGFGTGGGCSGPLRRGAGDCAAFRYGARFVA